MKTLIFIIVFTIICANSVQVIAQSCYRANALHTGCFEGQGPGVNPKIIWRFKTNAKIFSSPVLSKSIIFIGSEDSCFYAIDKTNGNLQWKFKTGGRINSSAAVYNNIVYVNSFDGFVYAFHVDNGKLLWKFDTGGEKIFSARNLHGVKTDGKVVEDPWDMYLSSPVISQDKVFIGSGNGNFFAIHALTGELVWKFKTNGVIHSSPAIAGDSVYFASWDSYIYALDSNHGKELWRFKTGIDTINYNQVGFQSSPAISGSMLYIGCRDANMRAIDRFKGKLRWIYSTKGSWIIGAPAIDGKRVYFGTSDSYRILSLDAESGVVIFDQHAKSYIFSSPAIAAGKLYVGTFGGFLYRMDCNTGETCSIFRTQASIENGKTYLNSDSTFNNAKIFSNPSWNGMLQSMNYLYSMGSILSSPAISENTIYFGSTDGYLYALE